MHTIPFKPLANNNKQVWMVRRAPGSLAHRGLLRIGQNVFACNLGRSGISIRKREGDGATPAGSLSVLGGYRNTSKPFFAAGSRKLRQIDEKLGWCDEPNHPSYNRPVRLPYSAGHEKMLRTDRLYDFCLVLDWNISKRARNRGSAIFLHLTRPDNGPTQGCIALDPALMRRLLSQLVKGVEIRVIA